MRADVVAARDDALDTPVDLRLQPERSAPLTNSQEKRVNRLAQSKGYRLEKVGKGPHHGRFAIVNLAEGARVASGVPGDEFSFSLQEAEDWLSKRG